MKELADKGSKEYLGPEEPAGWDDYQERLYEQQADNEIAALDRLYMANEKLARWAATNDSKFGLKVAVGTRGVVTWGPQVAVVEGQRITRAVFWDPKAECSRTVMFSGALGAWAARDLSPGDSFEISCALERGPGMGPVAWDVWAEGAQRRGPYEACRYREGHPSPLLVSPAADAKILDGFATRGEPPTLASYFGNEQGFANGPSCPPTLAAALREPVGRLTVHVSPGEKACHALGRTPWGLREVGIGIDADVRLPASLGRWAARWCFENRVPAKFAESPLGVALAGRARTPSVSIEGRVLWRPEVQKTAKGDAYLRVYIRTAEGKSAMAVFWGQDIEKLPKLDGSSHVRLAGELRPAAPQAGGAAGWLEIQRPHLELVAAPRLAAGAVEPERLRHAVGMER
jgi:hypothetical protein